MYDVLRQPINNTGAYFFDGMVTLTSFVDTLDLNLQRTDECTTKAQVVEVITIANCALGVGVLLFVLSPKIRLA